MNFTMAYAINKTTFGRDYSGHILHYLNLQQPKEPVSIVDVTCLPRVQKMEGTANSKPVHGSCGKLLEMMEGLTDDISHDKGLANHNHRDDPIENDATIDQIFRSYETLLMNQEAYEEAEAKECNDSLPTISNHQTKENAENNPDIEHYVTKLTVTKKRRPRKRKQQPRKPDFLCPVCGKLFTKQNGERHFYTAHCQYIRDKLCQICGKGFITKEGLREHSKTHVTEARFKCSYPNCEKLFNLKRYRRRHEFAVHRKEKHLKSKCKICGKGFPTREQMEAHKSWHKPEDFPKCRICFEVMSSHVTRLIHERRHRNEKYSCKYCDKQFLHYAALATHQRIHTGELPYKCPKCSLAFSQHYSRVRHLKTHKEGEELLKCDQCDNHYRSKRDLNRHLKLHVDSSQEAKEVLLKCPTCTFQYRTLRGLRGHHLFSHGTPLCEEDLTGNPFNESSRHTSSLSLPNCIERTSEILSPVPDSVSGPSVEQIAKQGENSATSLCPLEKQEMKTGSPSDRGISSNTRLFDNPCSTLRRKERMLQELADLTDISEDNVMKLSRRSARKTATPNYCLDGEGSEDESDSTDSESGSVYEPSDVDETDDEEMEAHGENEEEIHDEGHTKHVEDSEYFVDEEGTEGEPKVEFEEKVVKREQRKDTKQYKNEKIDYNRMINTEEEEEYPEKGQLENMLFMEGGKVENPKQNEEEEIEKYIKIKVENVYGEISNDLFGDDWFTMGSNALSIPAQEGDTKVSHLGDGETPKEIDLSSSKGFFSYHADSLLEKIHEENKMSVRNLDLHLLQDGVGTHHSFRTAKLILRKINLEECLHGVVLIKGECSDIPEVILPKPRTWSYAKFETF